jgi:parallel beta-helix repeat protein
VPTDYPTIQEGIYAAAYGDTVLVAAGIYTEHIVMRSGVIVQGTGGSLSTPDDPSDDSIIDSGESGRPVDFRSNVSNASLVGFTITNGRGEHSGGNIACSGEANTIKDNLIINGRTTGSYGGYGGGVYLGSGADYSKVVNNVIRDNWAWASGGGIHSRADGVVFGGNVISSNQSDWAGGVYVSGISTFIIQNIIDANYADYRHGGGIYVYSSASDTVIENNTVVSNTARAWGFGGAMYIYEVDEITIRNNLVVNNWNAETGNTGGSGGIHFVSCPVTLTLTYNDAYNNQGSDYSGCNPGDGSISADPLFVDPGNRDYHLQSGSLAIDAGDPDPAYNDPEDPANPGYALYPAMGTVRNDMGAYGGRSGVEPLVPLDSVTVLGPLEGAIVETYLFTATVTPIYASVPITYIWQATEKSPETHTGRGLNDTVVIAWDTPGTKAITVTATNVVPTVTGTHTITISEPSVPAPRIAKTVTPQGQVNYGDELIYTLVISATPGMQLGIYDPLTSTTFLRFVESVGGITCTNYTITGTLTVTPTNQITVSFVVQVGVPGTVGWTVDVTNRACVFPVGGTLGACVWSNEVTNSAFRPYDIYLPITMRNY